MILRNGDPGCTACTDLDGDVDFGASTGRGVLSPMPDAKKNIQGQAAPMISLALK